MRRDVACMPSAPTRELALNVHILPIAIRSESPVRGTLVVACDSG